MNENAEKQKPDSVNKRQIYLMAAIAVLALFIIVSAFLILLISTPSQPAEPEQMLLRHPSGGRVIGGTTKEDLNQAMELAKQWLKSSFKQNEDRILEQGGDMVSLINSGRVALINDETKCSVLESDLSMCKVQLLEGLKKGQTYWVYRECVDYAQKKQSSAGYVAAMLCARYLIIAVICCTGIYFLRIKSIFLMIVCFILAYLILNLIWVRIVSLFLF